MQEVGKHELGEYDAREDILEYEDVEEIRITKDEYEGRYTVELRAPEEFRIREVNYGEKDKKTEAERKLIDALQEVVEIYSDLRRIKLSIVGSELLDEVHLEGSFE